MEPITTPSDLFEQDDALPVTEMEDGSAVVELPAQERQEESAFDANLAETLPQGELETLSSDLLELIELDQNARKKRDEQYEEGLRRTGMGDDAPGGALFVGASKVVHPAMAEGCVDFAARAIKELVPANGPVKIKIIGNGSPEKLDKAKRKRDFLNFLLMQKVPEYRSEKEIMLTQLPLGGSQFEKYWHDSAQKRLRMEFVPIDKMLLPFSAASFYSSPRATHIQEITRQTFEERVASGFYRDIENRVDPPLPEQTKAQTANDKIEGEEQPYYNADGLRLIYEVSCEKTIEGDDPRPYVIHIDEPTGKVLAIYRNWKEDDQTTQKLDWWVEDKFIPWRGVYAIGLPHLIGGISAALTGALRALLDSAHINNSPGAIKLKGTRASGQNVQVAQTAVVEMDAPAGVDDIRKVMMPLPFNPPSNVLFQLLDWLTGQAKGVVATAEERIADASNTMPVGTALALIEQGSQVFSSIHARLHESQRRALEIVCRLVRDNAEDYQADFQRFGLTPEDFADTSDIQPVSDPNIFSESQRYAQLQEQLKLIGALPQLPWNFNEIGRRGLELLRTDDIDSLLPKPKEPVTADPVSENIAAADGAPLKTAPQQDHLAHIMTHLGYVVNPVHQLNPLPQPYLMAILGHVGEHLNVFYEVTAQARAVIVQQQAMASGEQLGPDQVAMRAAQMAQQEIAKLLQQVAPMAQQAQQIAQQKTPKPQYPPEVQATYDAAMAQISQKAESDKAKLQSDQQRDAQAMAMEQMQMRLDQMAAQQKQQAEASRAAMQEETRRLVAHVQEQGKQHAEQLRQQVELLKNERDNTQHQITELLKNNEDNKTAVLIEQLRQSIQQGNDAATQQLTSRLAKIESDVQSSNINDLMSQIASSLQALQSVSDGMQEFMAGQKDHQSKTMDLVSKLLSGAD